MKLRNLLLASVLLTLNTFSAHAANILYNVNRSFEVITVPGIFPLVSGSVIGTITTDGTIGQLGASNVIDFSLDISNSSGSLVHLGSLNAQFTVNFGPERFTADAANLYYDFTTATRNGIDVRFGNNLGAWSLSPFVPTGGPRSLEGYSGETAGLLIPRQGYVVSIALQTGNIAFATVSPVPEPAEWAMMLAGLAVISAVAKRRKSA
jgi:hypothetical protein